MLKAGYLTQEKAKVRPWTMRQKNVGHRCVTGKLDDAYHTPYFVCLGYCTKHSRRAGSPTAALRWPQSQRPGFRDQEAGVAR